MDQTLLAGLFAVLGGAIAALATYWVKLREDIRTGRALEVEMKLDLEATIGASRNRLKASWGSR
jgi:hypothetical protein